jgi:hypothetical protein
MVKIHPGFRFRSIRATSCVIGSKIPVVRDQQKNATTFARVFGELLVFACIIRRYQGPFPSYARR